MTSHEGQSRPPSTGPSRRVRLRRTIAAALALVLIGVLVGYRLAQDGADELDKAKAAADAAAKKAGVSVTRNPSSTAPQPRATETADGSSTPESTKDGAVPVPQKGNGKLAVVDVPGPVSDHPGRVVTFSIEIEGGLGVDRADVAKTIRDVLLDDRSWQSRDGVRLVGLSRAQVTAGRHVDIRITLASPGLTDKLCAPLRTLSQVSCWNHGRSVLNFRRWQLGDDSYGTDVKTYRVYQINHEVGHGLGHQHADCPGKGKRAPVMVQQTLSLGGCKPWPWPAGA